jgi:hypothetical protein
VHHWWIGDVCLENFSGIDMSPAFLVITVLHSDRINLRNFAIIAKTLSELHDNSWNLCHMLGIDYQPLFLV